MKRGDIRWYRFSKPDKKRPVLVLTRTSAIEFLNEVTVVQLTTAVRDIPTEVALDEDDGVPTPCALNFDRLFTVDRSKLGALVCELPSGRWPEVEEALLFALGFGH